jgi:hypothetical protein
MKTVAAFVRARSASFWMDVLAGRMPRASREVRVRGRTRSYSKGERCGG